MENGKFLAAKLAALIIRLLHIQVPQKRIEMALKLKSKKNQIFAMY